MASNLGLDSSLESSIDVRLNERSEWLRVTFSLFGDAVLAVDAKAEIIFLNNAAETWTGWTQAEAIGNPLRTVFRVIEETSQESIEGLQVGRLPEERQSDLTDRHLLIARDGSTRPIDWSTTSLRDNVGGVAGHVLILRDDTKRRQLENANQKTLTYVQEILATLREPFLVLDNTFRVVTANAAFYQTFQVSGDQTVGRFLSELGDGQWNLPTLQSLLEEKSMTAIPVHDFEVEHHFPAIGHRDMVLNARRFPPDGQHPNLILLAIQDVTDRKRSEASLKDSELRFRRLFLSAKDGILILDTKLGTIIEANPFMSGLLGYEMDEFLGKELWEIGLFKDKEANQEAYQELRSRGYIRYEHLPLRTKGGHEVDVEFVSNVYMVGARQVAQCNIRDITHRCRMERQAQSQATAMADLHRRKDEFLAMLSHELRNPLSPILNAVHMLRLEGRQNLIQREARDIIERQVGQLSRLIDDLLEVARFTSGKIHLNPMRLDARSVVEHAVESARPLITSRGHVLKVDVPDQPVWLNADPARLEQVVVNLLNNAAKYTDQGGQIWLKLRIEGSEMVVSVRDTGIGIDLKNFPEIFDLFTQASRSLDRSEGGLGIGLSLVQRLVEMHQGTVEVHSDGLGKGSEFIVRLPMPISAGPEPPSVIERPAERPAHAGRILVVDDNVDSADILAKLLRRSGHDVQTAYTGPTALIAAIDYLPEVVLLDIGLPGHDGYEVARRLRQDPRLKDVRLVAMTGYGQESDRKLAKEAGFDRHLVKPVNIVEVEEILKALLAPKSK